MVSVSVDVITEAGRCLLRLWEVGKILDKSGRLLKSWGETRTVRKAQAWSGKLGHCHRSSKVVMIRQRIGMMRQCGGD